MRACSCACVRVFARALFIGVCLCAQILAFFEDSNRRLEVLRDRATRLEARRGAGRGMRRRA